MKIALFLFVLWTICLLTSHQIQAKHLRNIKNQNDLNEIKQLLQELENTAHDHRETNEIQETGSQKKPESEDEQEYEDAKKELENVLQRNKERKINKDENIKGRQGKFLQRMTSSRTYTDRPSKSRESMPTFDVTDREGLLAKKNIKEWKKTQEKEKEEDTEEFPVENPENIDPNDPLSNLLEGMEIENKGKIHLVQGLHPEDSAKTYGDSHDSHRFIPEQITELELETVDSGAKKRNFYTYKRYFWKDGIVPYKIKYSSFYDPTTVDTVINTAIKQFNDNTCVKWITTSDSRFNQATVGQNVVIFINDQGCWSFVGNIYPYGNNTQYLSLEQPGCVSVATAVHEMLHAMGGHHEQSRSDRDNYVTIEWPNVRKGRNNINMKKFSTQDNNPYDAESAMQYSLYAASKNGQKTIKFKDQRLEFLADSADGLEFYDMQDVIDAYKCTDHCTNRPNCTNGGFINVKCTCSCPDVLTGATCEQTVSNTQTCGGVITLAVGEERLIQSPNYPSTYPIGLECTWLIKGIVGNIVRASVQYMNISSGSACSHWLEYRYNLLGQKGPKKCGTNFVADEEIWDSTPDELSNAMIIRFDSNTFSTKPAATGFSIKVQSIGKGCVSNPCIYGKCSSPVDTSDYTCTCNQGISGKNCDVPIASSVINCTFEYGERCIFENEANHQLNWNYQNKGSTTIYSGPDNAHTGYQYMYMEASGTNRQTGDKAVMSTNLQLPNVSHCMTFWYHMKGTDMGTLNIYHEGINTAKSNLWTQSGSQGNYWIKGEVDIPALNGQNISIEGVRGSGRYSNIAIDDISLSPRMCANPVTVGPTNPQPTRQSTAIPTRPTGGSQTCTFEFGASCFFIEATNDDFDWTHQYGGTVSPGTGPSSAYEGVMYKYIEVSDPVRSNSVARLMSRSSLNVGDHCLTFAYHMYGAVTMGDLKISTGVTAPENVLFKQSGNHGDQWNKGMVEFTTGARMKLFIEANKGVTFQGDIALDDIELKSGSCNANPVTLSPTNPPTTTTIRSTTPKTTTIRPTTTQSNPTVTTDCRSEYTCGFEGRGNVKCVFENTDEDDFDWDYNSGSTSSLSTGPDYAYEGSVYMYTEASGLRMQGDKAVLSTVNTRLAGKSTYCLQFYLHMNGEPGTFVIKYDDRGSSSSSSVWSLSGDQGNQWKHHQVELLPCFSNPVISFEATRGSSFKSDIALDSVKLSVGECHSLTACTINPCNNGGTCTEDSSTAGYNCNCMAGWSGDNCNVKVTKSKYVCRFETDVLCIFKDSSQDDFDWIRHSGMTLSSGTGPSGAAVGYYYIYIEATSRKDGDKAILTTEPYNLQGIIHLIVLAIRWCLTFQYHMKGRSLGSLEVFAGDKSSSLTSIWTKTGMQPNPDLWKTATIDIPQFSDPAITIEGSTGPSFQGDIAIDDLNLDAGTCSTQQ